MRTDLPFRLTALATAALAVGCATSGGVAADWHGPWFGVGGVFVTDPHLINASFWLHRPGSQEMHAAVPGDLLCKVGWYEANVRCEVSADGRMKDCQIVRFWTMESVGKRDETAVREGVLKLARASQLDRSAASFRTAADGTVQLTISHHLTCDVVTVVPVGAGTPGK